MYSEKKKQVLAHGKTGFIIETGFRYFEKQKTGKQVLDHPPYQGIILTK